MTPRRIKSAAIKKPSGKVVTKRPPAHHVDVAAKDRDAGGTGRGKRGFVTTPDDKFVGRQVGKKIAKKAGQANVRGKRGLHSEDVFGHSSRKSISSSK